MKMYIFALLMVTSVGKASEAPQQHLKDSCLYNPYSLRKIASLNVIKYLGQSTVTSELKAKIMNNKKTNPDVLSAIAETAIEHMIPSEMIKKIEFYFPRLPKGQIRETIQQKMLWYGMVTAMSNALLNNCSFPADEEEAYDDIAGQTVYAQEATGKECIISGKKKLYIFKLLNAKPKLVDATTIMSQGEGNRAVTASALYTHDDMQTGTKKRTVVFGTDDRQIWMHRTGPTEMLSAPLGLIITKIVYDINTIKNEINKIGLIARDDQGDSYAYVATEDDHPQERGEWFKGSELWELPVSNVTSLMFKNNYIVAHTPTSQSIWVIKNINNKNQLLCQDIIDEEDTYQIPQVGTQVEELQKIDHRPALASGVLVG